MPESGAMSSPKDAGGKSPADDLADVWDVLDTLPAPKPAKDLTATTVELVAARVANEAKPSGASQSRWIDRVVPFASILGGLLVGLVAGRATAPDPDAKVLERLPVIEHLGLLQELGSVDFLEALAEQLKEGQANPPRWLRFVRDPAGLRSEADEFEAMLVTLRAELAKKASSTAAHDRRRERVAKLPSTELAALEKSAATFEAMTPIDRRELEHLAAVLVDPAQTRLHDAAKLWHLIVVASNPAFRRNIIDMSSAERLEWLARSAGRFDQRPSTNGRDGERGDDRRPMGPRREGPDERTGLGGWPPPFQRPPLPPEGGQPTEPPPRGPSIKAPRDFWPGAPKVVPSETRVAPR